MAEEAYDPNENRDQFIQRMEEMGLAVHLPGPKELQIDIDSDAQFRVFQRSLEIFQREVGASHGVIPTPEITPSRSGLPRRHIRITLPFEVTPFERIAWQAALGSDPVRELLSCLRAHRGDLRPTLFLEKAS